MHDHPRISIDPAVMVGKPCIKDRRVTVELIIRHIANGWSREEICMEYDLTPEDIEAALNFAADQLPRSKADAAE
jgi:uncharacterized protein (DUF433 family)